MKTFLNVLYRRILYKIPLKFLLVLLAVLSLGIACFSNASNLDFTEDYYFKTGHLHLTDVSIVSLYDFQNNPDNIQFTDLDSVCLIISAITGFTNPTNANSSLQCGINQTNYVSNDYYLYYNVNSQTVCFPLHSLSNYNKLNCKAKSLNYINGSVDFDYGLFLLSSVGSSGTGNCPTCPSCPGQYTSLECQSEYSLIPISSVDSNYCESNNLCSSSDCPSYTGDLTSGVSNIFINDIFHPGSFNIIMNIPEEIDWDYAYTNSGQNMNIDIVGYNVDYDYINEQVGVQTYKPDDEDLSNIVSTVLPLFVPGLCIILLLYFIFKFIKKIF